MVESSSPNFRFRGAMGWGWENFYGNGNGNGGFFVGMGWRWEQFNTVNYEVESLYFVPPTPFD